MPVYEFYCCDCHTIFNFLSRRVNTSGRPNCPKCGRPALERQVSHFAISRGQKDEPSEDVVPGLDESKLEKAMMSLASEMEGVDENDPRQMARIMRRISEATGMNLGGEFDEAVRRLEAGEDPEKIEEEMGDLFTEESMEGLFSKEGMKGLKRKYVPPAHDDTLYLLQGAD